MDLTPYVEAIRRELAVAAGAGGDDARELAERLTAPLESAVRLALLDALSDAAAEITTDLAPGSVDLRLRGREPTFVVTAPPSEADLPAAAPQQPPADDEAATARTNIRLSEQLTSLIVESAGRAGLSVNAWLVRAAASALNFDEPARRPVSGADRLTGWVR